MLDGHRSTSPAFGIEIYPVDGLRADFIDPEEKGVGIEACAVCDCVRKGAASRYLAKNACRQARAISALSQSQIAP
jgi:hypothetical protein